MNETIPWNTHCAYSKCHVFIVSSQGCIGLGGRYYCSHDCCEKDNPQQNNANYTERFKCSH